MMERRSEEEEDQAQASLNPLGWQVMRTLGPSGGATSAIIFGFPICKGQINDLSDLVVIWADS